MTNKFIRSLAALAEAKLITPEEVSTLEEVTQIFSLGISPQLLALIDKNNPNGPIAKQFIPSLRELTIAPNEQNDPIGDEIYKSVKGIVHRYPDRCLLMPVTVCPVYCRFCFRREKVGNGDETLNAAELENAYQYIESHPEIWEVIITGGDPFILKPVSLKKIIQRLNSIPQVEIIRIHTRVPVVDSERINTELLEALQSDKPIYILIHANHPQEFTPLASIACKSLADAGIPLLSQTTLLQGINDDIATLSQLMRCFLKNRIKPYYIHHGDLAKGTKHFRTSIAHGQTLMRQLRGHFSGLCQPTYVLDIPGGHGKTPIGPCYLHTNADNHSSFIIEDYQGNFHNYLEE